MTPVELKLSGEQRLLSITWQDGAISHMPAAFLRSKSRAASAVRAAVDGAIPGGEDVTLVDLEPVGSYAVRLIFSDGHDGGIYPWTYLREIASAA